ncbi:hypothetical protein RQP46_010821 [Phenoliferia psychrophenolica]
MAPKAKPRGLKASSKAPPPAAATVPAAAPAAAEGEGSERTFPLDEDALTISDLFELRQTSSTLLSSSSSTADQVDEAQSLLRGILHGCQSLLDYFSSLPSTSPSFFALPLSLPSSTDDPSLLPRLTALGLLHPLAPSHIAYLQASSLHDLSSVLPPPPSAIPSSLTGANKKRKIAQGEPTKPAEWLDEAIERYDVAVQHLPKDGEGKWKALVMADRRRAQCDRAVLSFLANDEQAARASLKGIQLALTSAVDAFSSSPTTPTLTTSEEDDLPLPSSSSSLLRALSSFLAITDGFPSPSALADIQAIKHAVEKLAGQSRVTEAKALEVGVLAGDVAMAQFVVMAEAVEDRYRPGDDDDDDEEEEGEVVPLPDEEDVRAAKDAGRSTITHIRKTLTLIDSHAPNADDATKLKSAQYTKLEEAYLTLSALINPDDEAATDEIEDALAKVREEGGLEGEDDDDKDDEDEE